MLAGCFGDLVVVVVSGPTSSSHRRACTAYLVQAFMPTNNGTTRAQRSIAKDVGAGGAVDVADVLFSRHLEAWPIPLKNIRFTEHCRQLNERTVRSIINSINEVGWMPTSTPQVTIPDLPDGEEMTSDLAATLSAFVLDGNHRLKAAQTVYRDDPEKTVTSCQCYREMRNTLTKKILADGERETYQYVVRNAGV